MEHLHLQRSGRRSHTGAFGLQIGMPPNSRTWSILAPRFFSRKERLLSWNNARTGSDVPNPDGASACPASILKTVYSSSENQKPCRPQDNKRPNAAKKHQRKAVRFFGNAANG